MLPVFHCVVIAFTQAAVAARFNVMLVHLPLHSAECFRHGIIPLNSDLEAFPMPLNSGSQPGNPPELITNSLFKTSLSMGTDGARCIRNEYSSSASSAAIRLGRSRRPWRNK